MWLPQVCGHPIRRYDGRGMEGGQHDPGHSDPYRELFERSADAILIIEGDEFVDCNAATVKMLRYRTKEELLRTHPSELSPPTQPDGRSSFEKANEMIALAFEHGSHRFEWDHVRADGEVFPVEVLLTAVPRDGKNILHVVWRDITERKLLESQLRHAQKMEAIGKLAGGIAHDFNNLLVAIIGQSELLEEELAAEPEHAASVAEIRSAGERAARLVRQLLIFSRKQELVLNHLDLRAILEDLMSLLRRLIGENIELWLNLPSVPVPVKSDKSQLEQVVINLVTNARDAMPSGGELVVSLDVEELQTTPEDAPDRIEAGVYATLLVRDTGTGMNRATIARAFDPFFTTKGLGEGTGLGLATVYGIAKRSGGTVVLHSVEGEGTRAKVYLPISRQGTVQLVTTKVLPTRGGEERILVVEDEPAVSNLVVDVLKKAGYSVLLASNGARALEIWEQRSADIDLLLTDVVMPEMGGAALVQELHRRGNPPTTLFMSGYTNRAIEHLGALGIPVDLLEKPFSGPELVGRVRIALDRAAETARS